MTLIHRDGPESEAGYELLAQVSDHGPVPRTSLSGCRSSTSTPPSAGQEAADFDGAIELARAALDNLLPPATCVGRGLATTTLVESLLLRGADGDIAEAQAAIDTLAAVPTDPGFVMFELPLLRMRALLARAQGDEDGYRDYRDRYRTMATDLGFEGHMQWAEADDMTRGALPSGVVTFLFTDIEGSTRRWEADPEVMRAALAAHDEVLRRRSRRTAVGCSSTPATGCAPCSPHPGRRWMLRSPRSRHWNCRCGWGSRPGRPSCGGRTTSVRC